MSTASLVYSNYRFLQFARRPVAGKVKTRLIPALGAQAACQLHQRLALHCLQSLVDARLAAVELWLSEVSDYCPLTRAAGELSVPVMQQCGDHLGEKMATAIDQVTASGSAVILVGSDCPAIDAGYLLSAITALEAGVDVVLGPAEDGGYVLIGMNQPYPVLFEGVEWGSEQVLQQTIARINDLKLSHQLLQTLADIDRPEDLECLPAYNIALPVQ